MLRRASVLLALCARAVHAGFVFSDEYGRSYLLDLCFTSEGVVKLSIASFLFLILYTIFGPQPVDEREIILNEQWACHKQARARVRAEAYHSVGGLTPRARARSAAPAR